MIDVVHDISTKTLLNSVLKNTKYKKNNFKRCDIAKSLNREYKFKLKLTINN